MEIISAVKEDIQTLNTISIESKMHWNYPRDWLDHWIDELTITKEYLDQHSVYKLIVGGKIIGFCAIEEHPEAYEISHLWILPAYMRRGYGKKLLSESLNCSVDEKKDIIVVADPNAESFYASQGFQTFDQKPSYPEGRFLPVMRKSCSN